VPTLIREAGFEVRIYTLDHPPPHVHSRKLAPNAMEIVGAISDRDIWEKLHARP
jgi:hypothetical protein